MASDMPKLSAIFHARACFPVPSLFSLRLCSVIVSLLTMPWNLMCDTFCKQACWKLNVSVFFSSHPSPPSMSPALPHSLYSMCVCICEGPLHTLLLFTFRKFSSQLLDDLLNISQPESFKEPQESINARFCTEAQVRYFYQNVLIQHKYFRHLCMWFLPLLSEIAARTKRHQIIIRHHSNILFISAQLSHGYVIWLTSFL